MRSSTLRVFASMRMRRPASFAVAHTEPPPTVTRSGIASIAMCRVCRLRGLMRVISSSTDEATQTAPSPTAIPFGPAPTRTRAWRPSLHADPRDGRAEAVRHPDRALADGEILHAGVDRDLLLRAGAGVDAHDRLRAVVGVGRVAHRHPDGAGPGGDRHVAAGPRDLDRAAAHPLRASWR